MARGGCESKKQKQIDIACSVGYISSTEGVLFIQPVQLRIGQVSVLALIYSATKYVHSFGDGKAMGNLGTAAIVLGTVHVYVMVIHGIQVCASRAMPCGQVGYSY